MWEKNSINLGKTYTFLRRVCPSGSDSKESACKIPEEGNGNPLQYSCLENPMDRGAWQATVCGTAKSWT